MEISEIVKLIMDNGALIVVLAYLLFKDNKNDERTAKKDAETSVILQRLDETTQLIKEYFLNMK